MHNDSPIPPRQWAAEIAAVASLAERRALLEQVPEHCRPLVEAHLKILWARRAAQRSR